MKTKLFAFILVFALLFCLAGCSSKTREVEEMVAAIGDTVTLESESAILAARAAFDALSEKQQEQLLETNKLLRRAEHSLEQAQKEAFAEVYNAVVDKVASYNDAVLNETVLIAEVWEHVGKDECLEAMQLFSSLTCDEDFDTVFGEEADAKRAEAVKYLFGDDASFDGFYYQTMAMVNWYGPIHQEALTLADEVKADAAALREQYGERYPDSLDVLDGYITFSDEFASATRDFTEVRSETAVEYIDFMQFFLSLLQEQEIACLESVMG